MLRLVRVSSTKAKTWVVLFAVFFFFRVLTLVTQGFTDILSEVKFMPNKEQYKWVIPTCVGDNSSRRFFLGKKHSKVLGWLRDNQRQWTYPIPKFILIDFWATLRAAQQAETHLAGSCLFADPERGFTFICNLVCVHLTKVCSIFTFLLVPFCFQPRSWSDVHSHYLFCCLVKSSTGSCNCELNEPCLLNVVDWRNE